MLAPQAAHSVASNLQKRRQARARLLNVPGGSRTRATWATPLHGRPGTPASASSGFPLLALWLGQCSAPWHQCLAAATPAHCSAAMQQPRSLLLPHEQPLVQPAKPAGCLPLHLGCLKAGHPSAVADRPQITREHPRSSGAAHQPPAWFGQPPQRALCTPVWLAAAGVAAELPHLVMAPRVTGSRRLWPQSPLTP